MSTNPKKKIIIYPKKERIIKTKKINKCEIEKNNLELIKIEHKKIKSIYDKCIQQNFTDYTYNPITLKKLLSIIKEQKSIDVIDLLNQFPHPGSGIPDVSNTDSHVFEALWILVFLFNYDELLLPNNIRKFKQSLEENKQDERTINEIIENTNINASNSGGICDIIFSHEDMVDKGICPKCNKPMDSESTHKCEDRVMCQFSDITIECGVPSCESDTCMVDKKQNMNTNFLFSAKYFNKEKGVEKYDIPSIIVEALPKLDNFNIILLVKDKLGLQKKMDKSKKQITNRFYKIMDVGDLDTYYKQLKYDLSQTTISNFIEKFSSTKLNNKPPVSPRFHQQYFIDYSIEQFKSPNPNYKLIWGAVPRSGKSYMIGGLIAKQKPQQVVIFLGAITETVSQFYSMFKDEYSDFDDYNIVDVQKDGFKKIKTSKGEKNIVLISQQKGWVGKDDIPLLSILEEKNKIIFFDEIHQGSSIGTEQTILLDRYVFNKPKLESPFIMVTATFAKPLLRYMTKGKTQTKLIQWSYEDIQTMKSINLPYVLDNFLDKIENDEKIKEDGELKTRMLNNIITDLNKRGITLEHLSKQYEKYPNLVVMCPELEEVDKKEFNKKETTEDEFNPEINTITKNSICDIIFKCTKNKFNNPKSLSKFIKYIKKNVYGKLLLGRFGFNYTEKQHTQLWFLPTPAGCHAKETNAEKLEGLKEGTKIENATRLLAQELTKSEHFGNNFCILVINSQKLSKELLTIEQKPIGGKLGVPYDKLEVTSYEKDSKNACISTKCAGNKKKYDGSIADCIKEQEACAKAKGKSLIILTGMKLRLGISLPCVDVVLHMDPIKDVDTIYQSMFRVLTENKNKKQGYFVDLLSDRFIDFMYQYDNYTNKGKKNIDVVSKRAKFTETLFNFNINGILGFGEDKTKHKLYVDLIKKLKIDTIESFADTIEDTQEKQIKEVLSMIDDTIINKYYYSINNLQLVMIGKKPKQPPLRVPLVKPENDSIQPSHMKQLTNNNSNSSKPEKDTEVDIKDKKELIISYIKDVFSLFVLFESEILLGKEITTSCSENNIEELIKFLESYTIEPDKLKYICKNNKQIIDCHISYLNKKHLDIEAKNEETKKDIIEKLNQYRNILVDFLKTIKEDNKLDEFVNYFCSIRDKFGLINNSLKNREVKYVPKCPGNNEIKTLNTNMTGGGKELIDENILEIVRNYLTVKDKEKKLFGEVFTPVELVCEMLDKLPKNVWKDPKLTWLDPANGIGNYPIVVYYKLMEGLKGVKGCENEKERSEHIINNMLYMVELNPVNAKVCRKIFKMIEPSAKPNIYNEDFLEWSKTSDKYDIIIGNPPYNNSLHVKFITESLNILGSYLLFITPITWLSPTSASYKKLIEMDILLINNSQYIKDKYFKSIASTFSYFLVNNKKSNIKTKIIYEIGNKIKDFKINFKEIVYPPKDFNPLSVSINIKMLKKDNNKNFERNDKNDYMDTKTDEYKYPHITFVKTDGSLDVKFRKEQDKDEKKPKLLLFRNGYINPYFDNGKNGIGDNIHYKLLDDSKYGHLYEQFFKSKLISYIFKVNKYSAFNHGVLMNIINIDFLLNIDDKKIYKNNTQFNNLLYKYYKITPEELKFIEKTIPDNPDKTSKKTKKNPKKTKTGGKRTINTKKRKKRLVLKKRTNKN